MHPRKTSSDLIPITRGEKGTTIFTVRQGTE
jgi:hypothetical protein